MQQQSFYKTNRPFDKLRQKRTGSKFDAVDFHGRDIDLRSIAGVVEAGRRRDRKAGETNENRIEEAAERLDAMARVDASKQFYGGPKFSAERFAKAHNIDLGLRFDSNYERPDQIVANPPPRVAPPKPEPKPSFQEVMYPKENAARKFGAVDRSPNQQSQPEGPVVAGFDDRQRDLFIGVIDEYGDLVREGEPIKAPALTSAAIASTVAKELIAQGYSEADVAAAHAAALAAAKRGASYREALAAGLAATSGSAGGGGTGVPGAGGPGRAGRR